MKELDEKGFVFLDDRGHVFRCCMWGDNPWLFKWIDTQNQWVSFRKLTQMDVFVLPHNLSGEQQEWYFKAEAKSNAHLAPSITLKKFWVSWWTKYLASDGCTQPPFQMWESGMKSDEDGLYTISSMVALVEASEQQEIWSVIKNHFPDYEQRMCEPVADNWKPGDRFPDFQNRTNLY